MKMIAFVCLLICLKSFDVRVCASSSVAVTKWGLSVASKGLVSDFLDTICLACNLFLSKFFERNEFTSFSN